MGNRVVIVGAGHAGVQAATALAEADRELDIVLIDQDEVYPYERPPLSKEQLVSDGTVALKLLHGAEFYSEQGIELVLGRPVTEIDRANRLVRFADGDTLAYDCLILATGSSPLVPPVPGKELAGVYLLKTAQDAAKLRPEIVSGRRLFIVGAGYIGLEVATAAARAGCQVTVIEQQSRVMARVTSEVVSRFYEGLHQAAGVRLMLGAMLHELEGSGRVERVIVGEDRQPLDADAVVIGVGVRPNQALAVEAGLDCADGVLVDEFARTSDPAIYAIGDVSRMTSKEYPDGLRLESVQNAVAQARTAAADIVRGEAWQREVPWFWTVQHGVRLQTAGIRRESDDTVVRGDPGSGKFSVLYLRDGRLAAIDTVGSLRDFVPGKKLIGMGAPIDPARAADADVKLADAVLADEVAGVESSDGKEQGVIGTVSAQAAETGGGGQEEFQVSVVDRAGAEHRVPWREKQSLMEALRDNGLPVLASCGGTASCATCHVHLPEEIVDRLGERSDDELELLEEAGDYNPQTSRLSCQIRRDASLADVTVRLAEED